MLKDSIMTLAIGMAISFNIQVSYVEPSQESINSPVLRLLIASCIDSSTAFWLSRALRLGSRALASRNGDNLEPIIVHACPSAQGLRCLGTTNPSIRSLVSLDS